MDICQQHYLHTPQLGVGLLNPLSPDFLLYDDDNSFNINSKIQDECLFDDRKLFSDVEFSFESSEEKSEFIEGLTELALEWELQKLIQCSSFPIEPMEDQKSQQALECLDDIPWPAEECTIVQSPSSITSPASSSQYDDTDNTLSSVSSPSTIRSSVDEEIEAITIKNGTKRRHSRGLTTNERKQRKKVQNKTAAEKYRVKKKSEKQILSEKRQFLATSNKELKLETENLQYRIQQLKQLFFDILQVKELQPLAE